MCIRDSLGGLVVGAITDGTPTQTHFLTQDEVLDHYTRRLGCPVASGLVYGHIPTKNTMPVGVRARLSVDASGAARLATLEPVTEAA